MIVEIWSDIACPFCYLGKRYFEQALASLSFKDEVKVVKRSFILDPELPEEGLSISSYEYLLERKQLAPEYLEKMLGHLKQTGALVNIDFQQEKAIPANTMRAHRLLQYSIKTGKENTVEEALFKAYFTDGKNIGDIDVLKDIAKQSGLNESAVNTLFEGGQEKETVLQDKATADQLGIGGVPFFVVDHKYGISGAQPIDVFVDTLTQAYNELNPDFEMKGKNKSDVCGPDGCIY